MTTPDILFLTVVTKFSTLTGPFIFEKLTIKPITTKLKPIYLKSSEKEELI